MSKLSKWYGFSFAKGSPMRLFGTISDDSRFPDGHRVITSPVRSIAVEGGKLTATTETGTKYELGESAPELVLNSSQIELELS